MKIAELKQTTIVPDGVTVTIKKQGVTARGQHGEVSRKWKEPDVHAVVEGNKVIISAKNADKRLKRAVATLRAHIRNIIDGVKNNNEYKLKICSSHFPMQVSMEGNTLIVKNYFGEKVPRKITMPKDAQIKIQGDKIAIIGPDVDKVGEAASKMEQVCRITNRDRRIFQDGIFLIERNGKAI